MEWSADAGPGLLEMDEEALGAIVQTPHRLKASRSSSTHHHQIPKE